MIADLHVGITILIPCISETHTSFSHNVIVSDCRRVFGKGLVILLWLSRITAECVCFAVLMY